MNKIILILLTLISSTVFSIGSDGSQGQPIITIGSDGSQGQPTTVCFKTGSDGTSGDKNQVVCIMKEKK